MSPPGESSKGGSAAASAVRPLLVLEPDHRREPRAQAPRLSSLREAIVRWLEQPL
jgi:hypothetical protein